jgi:FkbM family methyltransferase
VTNVPRASRRPWAGRILRLPLRLIPPSTVVRVLQGRLRGSKWIAGASQHGCWLGTYERNLRRAFERRVAPGSVVFDLGAQAGFYTLLAARLVGPQGRVFAFEPLPDNLAYLRRHLELNRVTNVTIMESAVSDRSGRSAFGPGANRSMGRLDPQGRLQVATVALDDLVATGVTPLPSVVKIDIEGAEVLALKGARRTLERSRATLFLSTHGPEKRRECCRLLVSLGYAVMPLDALPADGSSELLATAGLRPERDDVHSPARSPTELR